MGEKNSGHIHKRILIPLKGSFKNFRPVPPVLFYEYSMGFKSITKYKYQILRMLAKIQFI